jgi:hypothetical protein
LQMQRLKIAITPSLELIPIGSRSHEAELVAKS